MSLKAIAHQAVERNRQRNQSATGELRSATGGATGPRESQYLSGSPSCVFSFPRKRNCATGEQGAQPAAQPERNWQQASDIARQVIERLAQVWDCPPGELEELQVLHRDGKLTLDYIERLIHGAPPDLRKGKP